MINVGFDRYLSLFTSGFRYVGTLLFFLKTVILFFFKTVNFSVIITLSHLERIWISKESCKHHNLGYENDFLPIRFKSFYILYSLKLNCQLSRYKSISLLNPLNLILEGRLFQRWYFWEYSKANFVGPWKKDWI